MALVVGHIPGHPPNPYSSAAGRARPPTPQRRTFGGVQQRATVCYMNTVTHREMRNNSGEILRRVEAGESVRVTNNGRVAAVIVPPATDALTDLAQRGQLRAALREPSTLRNIRRRATHRTSEQILADSRGQW
jgi:prevent-host-death family protein